MNIFGFVTLAILFFDCDRMLARKSGNGQTFTRSSFPQCIRRVICLWQSLICDLLSCASAIWVSMRFSDIRNDNSGDDDDDVTMTVTMISIMTYRLLLEMSMDDGNIIISHFTQTCMFIGNTMFATIFWKLRIHGHTRWDIAER